jgi:acetyl-CoA synthetase
MTRLVEMGGATTSWDQAYATFRWPSVTGYNIAADCLSAPPDQPAVFTVVDGQVTTLTFGELDRLSKKVAGYLATKGYVAGDRVAIKLSQSVEMAIAVLGVLRAGLVVVPLSTVIGGEGLKHRMADSRPRVLVAHGTPQDVELASSVGAQLIATTEGDSGVRLDDVLSGAVSASHLVSATRGDSPALLMYTSGTTGKPKGVLHGHRVLLGHQSIRYALDGPRPDDVAYSPVDWAWAGGMLLGLLVPLALGIPVLAHRDRRFEPDQVVRMLGDCGVSVGLFPPTALRLLRDSAGVAGDAGRRLRLRCLITGAEAVEPGLADWTETDLRATLNNAYGQTEANALVGHSSMLGRLDDDALGRPYPGHNVAVLDDSLAPAPAGVAGQIAVRADDPVCMLGYWQAESATAAKIRDGWLLTGDNAHVDDAGQMFFHGRNDDIIKSGGYRLGPAEIESAICTHLAVAECAVIGIPDPARGEIVAAFVRLKDGARADAELSKALQSSVRNRVGAHASPRAVRYVTELPRTVTGKVDRARLRTDAVRVHEKGGAQ